MILEILGIKNFWELCEGEGIFQEAPLGGRSWKMDS